MLEREVSFEICEKKWEKHNETMMKDEEKNISNFINLIMYIEWMNMEWQHYSH